jgi:hypothetical protein
VQALLSDVLMNATLIFEAARATGIASPFPERSRELLPVPGNYGTARPTRPL